jgi:CTP:molybdopterin cytidylyltransferase MocA
MKIVAILLAAGAGRRIGGPKALLTIDGESFLTRAAARLARPGVESVAAVVGHESDRVRREAQPPATLTWIENPRPADGMLGSILCGLGHAEACEADAVLIHPVDHPRIGPATVDRVVDALQRGATIAVPTWQERRGHPAGFARAAWEALRAAPPDRGARVVLAEHPEWVVHVEGDAGCVEGVNTPEDYARLIRG